MTAMAGRVAFGPFELDLETGELRRSGRVSRLPPQPATVLCQLVSNAGKLVSRDDIRRRLWGDSTFVDYDVGVDSCINRIRQVLGDNAQSPRFVETLPRRGYRFLAPVQRQRPFPEPTLAVLPFANHNADPARDYFADGVTDVLITELARMPSVRVLSRQSILHLTGSRKTLTEIADDLGVDGVVQGAVLQEGMRVRVTAQLILVNPERHAWAHTYDCDLSAILSTQREAALAIVASVGDVLKPGRSHTPVAGSLSPVPAAAAVAPHIVDTYLQGASELGKASAESLRNSLRCFREITLEAPGFAPGLAGHAVCLFILGWFGHAPAREVFPAAKQLAQHALAIDERLDVAQGALAAITWLMDGDISAADREFQRALELSPSNPDGHTLYALFLCCTGRYSEAIAKAQYALRLSRSSLIQNQAVAWVYLHAGEPERAEMQARSTLERFPDALQPSTALAWALWRQDRREDALAAFEHCVALSREAMSLAGLAHVYGRLSRDEEARCLLGEVEELAANGQASPISFVVIYAGLGDLDSAFRWLETARQLKTDLMWITPGFPGLDPLRGDQRFGGGG